MVLLTDTRRFQIEMQANQSPIYFQSRGNESLTPNFTKAFYLLEMISRLKMCLLFDLFEGFTGELQKRIEKESEHFFQALTVCIYRETSASKIKKIKFLLVLTCFRFIIVYSSNAVLPLHLN